MAEGCDDIRDMKPLPGRGDVCRRTARTPIADPLGVDQRRRLLGCRSLGLGHHLQTRSSTASPSDSAGSMNMTTTPLLAFHGDPQDQSEVTPTRVRKNRAADQLGAATAHLARREGLRGRVHPSMATATPPTRRSWQKTLAGDRRYLVDDPSRRKPVELARTWPRSFSQGLILVGAGYRRWSCKLGHAGRGGRNLNLPEPPVRGTKSGPWHGRPGWTDRARVMSRAPRSGARQNRPPGTPGTPGNTWVYRHAWDAWAAWAARHAWDAWGRQGFARPWPWSPGPPTPGPPGPRRAHRQRPVLRTQAAGSPRSLLEFLAAAPVAPVKPKRVAKLTRADVLVLPSAPT